MDYIEKAIKLLKEEEATCVALSDTLSYTSHLKGVAPLFRPMQENLSYFKDAYVVDKVIGKAAAILLIISGVKKLHANLISEHAARILEQHNIEFTYDEKVDYIINRDQTGMCPMEESVLDTDDLQKAYENICNKIKLLMQLSTS